MAGSSRIDDGCLACGLFSDGQAPTEDCRRNSSPPSPPPVGLDDFQDDYGTVESDSEFWDADIAASSIFDSMLEAESSAPALDDVEHIDEEAIVDRTSELNRSPKSKRPQGIIAAEAQEGAPRMCSRRIEHRTQLTTPGDAQGVSRLDDVRAQLDEHLNRTAPCVFRLYSNACLDPNTPLWKSVYGTTYFVNTEATKNWALSHCSCFGGVIYDDEIMLKAFIDDMCVQLDSYDANGKYKITEKYCGCDRGPTKSSTRTFHRRRDCVKRCPCNILARTCLKHGREHHCQGTGELKRKDYCECAECEHRRADSKERRARPAKKKAKTARSDANGTGSA